MKSTLTVWSIDILNDIIVVIKFHYELQRDIMIYREGRHFLLSTLEVASSRYNNVLNYFRIYVVVTVTNVRDN